MSESFVEREPPQGDLPLLEGESEDIRWDATELFGEAWLSDPNPIFGWQTPNHLIESGCAYLVRNNIRLIKYVGSV